MLCGKFTWHVGTHGSCVLDTDEVTIGRSRKIPIDEDARAVRPYRSNVIPDIVSTYLRVSSRSFLSHE